MPLISIIEIKVNGRDLKNGNPKQLIFNSSEMEMIRKLIDEIK